MTISRSPERGSFSIGRYKQKLEIDPTDVEALGMIEHNEEWEAKKIVKEESEEWQKDNLEYDLRSTDWILAKVRNDDIYAQHLYAAICNNDFQKRDTWPILKGETWSASWRYAGGIIADMQQKGDYIDWYCSGINNECTAEELAAMDDEGKAAYKKSQAHVPESFVTDEIREDLLKLGWNVIQDDSRK